jgi:DNA-binding CsgD family transcriptional regulator
VAADPTAGVLEDLYAGVLDGEGWRRALEGLARLWGVPGIVIASFDRLTGAQLHVEAEPPALREQAPPAIPPAAFTGPAAGGARRFGLCIARTRETLLLLCPPLPIAAELPLLSHLVRALTLRERVERSRLQSMALAASVARVNFALLVLDSAGRVVERNPLANRLLARDCGVKLGEDGVLRMARDGAPAVALRAGTARRGTEHIVRIERAGRAPLSVLLWPLRGEARWMVVLCDPEVPARFDLAMIAADLGLSLREAQTAAGLCNGLSIREVAAQLGVTTNTVRTHVKAVYLKAGAHSLVELVRRVAGSPAAMLSGG